MLDHGSSLGRSLGLAALLLGCRGRTPDVSTVDWTRTAGPASETAALLLVDSAGLEKIVCLPTRTQAKVPLPELPLRRLLDVGWNQGPVIVGTTDRNARDELLLSAPKAGLQTLATGVRAARLSPDATALVYEVETPGDETVVRRTSYVLELANGKTTALGPLVDPLWEADGKHLRATQLREEGERDQTGRRRAFRVRWDRESGTTAVAGPGSAQIPAPLGSSVAWTETPRAESATGPCAVFLTPKGGVKHSIVGRFCAGIADDRAVRWSPDGRWLAFPHPEPGPDRAGKLFVDVVSPDGGRYPDLSALAAKARPGRLAFLSGPAVWFDWSPSGRFLAFDSGAGELRVYDFEAHGVAELGKGARPTWSPAGTYLQVFENEAATVLFGSGRADRINLGASRDARWLPAEACAR
jgi:hypothetical protein